MPVVRNLPTTVTTTLRGARPFLDRRDALSLIDEAAIAYTNVLQQADDWLSRARRKGVADNPGTVGHIEASAFKTPDI